MLTTRFEELKMGDDKAFDSFYGKLNEIVIAKLNLGEKIEDSKVVRKILRSLLESFRAKVIARVFNLIMHWIFDLITSHFICFTYSGE